MAIVVNPVMNRRDNSSSVMAQQILANAVAKAKEDRRNDIDAAYQATGAELKAMIDDGRLMSMLYSDNPDDVAAGRYAITKYMDSFARRTGKKLTPAQLNAEVDAFAQKLSWDSATTEERARYAMRFRDEKPSATTPGAPPSSPNQPSSGSAPASGAGTSTTGPVTTTETVETSKPAPLQPDTITGFVPPAAEKTLGEKPSTATALVNEPYKGKTFEEAKSELYAANKTAYPDTAAKIAASRTWDDLKKTGVREGWKSLFGEYPDGSKTATKATISSTPEIAAESKKRESELSNDDSIPKIARASAKEVQEGAEEYKRIDAAQKSGAKLPFKDLFKKKQIEKKAADVWKAQQNSPGFKTATKEQLADMRKFVREASAVELSAAGMATTAEIKNDQERNRINELIANSQVKVATLQKEAAAGQAYAQVLMKGYEEAFSTINSVITATKGDDKALEKALKNPAIANTFNTVAALMGGTAEDFIKMAKTGFFGGLKPVQDSTFVDPLQNLQNALDVNPDQGGSKDSGLDYAKSVMGNVP